MTNFILIGIFVGCGLLFRRLKAFPKESAQVLNMFALYVSLPALILLKVSQLQLGREALVVAVVPWGMLLLSVLLIFALYGSLIFALYGRDGALKVSSVAWRALTFPPTTAALVALALRPWSSTWLLRHCTASPRA